MHPFITVLTALTISICMHTPPVHGKRCSENNCRNETLKWMGDWPCNKRFTKLKTSFHELQEHVKDSEKPASDPMARHEECRNFFKPPNYACTTYSECRADVMARAASLDGPLLSFEKDLRGKKNKPLKRLLKNVRKNLSKILKKAERTCRKRAVSDKEKQLCKVKPTNQNDMDWMKCKEKLDTKQVPMFLVSRLSEVVSPCAVSSDVSTAHSQFMWAKDWQRRLLELAHKSLKKFGEMDDQPDNDLNKNKHCQRLLEPADYCCSSYNDCKEEVITRLMSFVKLLNKTSKLLEDNALNTPLKKNVIETVEAVQNFAVNITGQCKRGAGQTKLRFGERACSVKVSHEDIDTCLSEIGSRLKDSNVDDSHDVVELLATKLQTYLYSIDMTKAKSLEEAEKKAAQCNSGKGKGRGRGRGKGRGKKGNKGKKRNKNRGRKGRKGKKNQD